MFSVAIDGPAGAGKSTIAKAAAKELELIYVDTGAMYRTIGLACLDDGISPENSKAVIEKLKSIVLELKYVDGEQRMILCGKDVSDDIRTERVSMTASVVSKIPEVRAFLLEQQRGFARSDNIIMDGRDIGTVVLPDAQVKIFLTASAESRAKRRTLQLEEKGIEANYDAILEDIRKRDYQDSHREIAPLKAAPDAVVVDTTELTLEGSINAVIQTIRKGMSEK